MKPRLTFFTGILIVLTGATGMLLSKMHAPWPHILVVAGLVLINAGLFWMERLLSESGETLREC